MLGLSTVDDETIWQHAASRRLTIVSKDADFVRLATTLGAPPKVIWLRIGNGPTSEIVALMQQRIPVVQAFLADPDSALLTLP